MSYEKYVKLNKYGERTYKGKPLWKNREVQFIEARNHGEAFRKDVYYDYQLREMERCKANKKNKPRCKMRPAKKESKCR